MQAVKDDRQTPYFDKDTTAVIKGVALIMMFAHHFFTFPDWWLDGIEYPILETIAPYFCGPLKLCVPVFCFLTGYFYFYNQDKSYSYSARKITDIFIDYWSVLFLLAVIARVTVHYVYSPVGLLKEMFALSRPTMVFCWYVYFYYAFMMIFPLIVRMMAKGICFDLLFSIILAPIFIFGISYMVSNYIGIAFIEELLKSLLWWFPTVLIGFTFARYKLFDKMAFYNSKGISSKKKTVFLWIIGALCVPMGRYVIPSFSLNFGAMPLIRKTMTINISFDFVYAPVFIYCLANLCMTVKLYCSQIILKQIGKYSLLMWFVSCIFYNNSKKVFQPVLYWPGNPILVLIWGLCLCYMVSAVLNVGLSIIKKKKNKIIFHKV